MTIDSNKIYNEIQELATNKFSFYYKLDSDERQTLISDTTLKIIAKMEQGKIPTEYKDYLGYMMISIKNGIYRVLNHRETIGYKTFNNSTEDHSYNHPVTNIAEIDYTDVILNRAIKKLDPADRAVIRWKLRGWLYTDIANAFQVPPRIIQYNYERITERLQVLYLLERRNYNY